MYGRRNGGNGGGGGRSQQAQQQGGERKPPMFECRIGLLKATVWENQGDKGTWPSVTLTRSYKQGEEWKTAQSFGKEDLPVLAMILQQVYLELALGKNGGEQNGDTPF